MRERWGGERGVRLEDAWKIAKISENRRIVARCRHDGTARVSYTESATELT